MTINLADNNPRIAYSVAQGATQQTFAVPFEFFNDSDLSVYVDGVLKAEGTDYTITGGDGSTGNVVFVTATPPDVQQVTGATGGSKVVIVRTTALERTSDFSAGADINRAALNEQLDILTAMAADLKDRADRTIQVNPHEIAPSLILPSLDSRKGKVLAFDATTGDVESGPTVYDISLIADNIIEILDADNQATAAASSASAASSSASAAASSASASASSASAAASSQSNAASSESAAASSASAASSSASAASSSASAASTSASNAASSASAASTSAFNAQTAADTALAALDNFDDRYLGQKTSDPSVDNDGNALVAGALYFNTTDDVMKVYDGSIWVAAYASLSGALIAANNLSDLPDASSALQNLGLTATATELNYTDGVTANIQAQLDSKAPTNSPTFTGNMTVDTNTLFVDATNNRVGIGTVTPASPLSVSAVGAALEALNPNTNMRFFVFAGNYYSYIGNSTNHPVSIFTNNTARVTVAANGNVGIGTSNPTTALDISGTANATTLSIGGAAITATAAELNILDGVTANAAELNTLDGITGVASQAQAEAGTDNATLMTPLRTAEAIAALAPPSGVQTFTASGAITAGNPVAINSDGTVSKVALSTGALLKQVALPTVQASNTINEYASATKIVGLNPAYSVYSPLSISDTVFVSTFMEGPAGPVKSRLVTISNGVMSTGSAFSSGITNTSSALVVYAKVTANKFAIFTTSGTTGTMVVGEVSGSTITFGSPVTVWSGVVSSIGDILADGNGGLLLVQNTSATNSPLRVAAISVTGTTPTVGVFTTLRSAAPAYVTPSLAYDPVNGVFLLTAWQQTSPFTIWSWGITISGTTVTVGSQTNAFGSELGNYDYPVLSYDAVTGRFVALTPFVTSTNSRIYTATVSSSRVITVSPQTTDVANTTYGSFKTTPDGTMLFGAYGGLSASVVTFDAGNSYKPILTAMPYPFANTEFWPSTSAGNSGYYVNQGVGVASLGVTYRAYGFSNVDKLVGVANNSATTGQEVTTAVNGGLARGLSGLSTSTQYFTNGAGGVATASTSTPLGLAVSSTEILLNTESV